MKIAFTGPESCGKTTLAEWFSEVYQFPLSPEFARSYLKGMRTYDVADLDTICLGQLMHWNTLGNKLVADSEITVLKVWSEFRFHLISDFILKSYQNQEFDHYFLCAPDIPWEPDSLRENPQDRDALFHIFENALIDMKRPFTVLKGKLSERQKACDVVLNGLINA